MKEITTIQKALNDLQQAENMHWQADKIYYRAKKQLEGICSPAVPPQNAGVAKAIARRIKSAYKKSA